MAAEWLRADQVELLRAAAEPYLVAVYAEESTLAWNVARLAAQDGRWRALVGLLTVYGRHRPYCSAVPAEACMCGWGALQMQAQAALDGAP